MLYFYYCQAYKDKVNATADKIIRKRISGFGKRSSLKGINSVVSHTGAVSVLTISNPYGLVVLQEDSNLIDGHTIYFVRDFLLETKVLLNYVQFKNGTWITNNPLNEEDKIECERTINSGFDQESIQIEKLIPPSSLTSWHSNYKLNIIYDIYETEEWMKFAINNAAMRTTDVKLFRILLQNISKKINDTTKYEILTEENCCKLVAATFENVGIPKNLQNPWYLTYLTRDDYASSKTMGDVLAGLGDSRLSVFGTNSLDSAPTPHGDEGYQEFA